jgi:tetratricopeptide (TPR) repeat protein
MGSVGPGGIGLQGDGNSLVFGYTAAQVEQLLKAEREGIIQQYTSQLTELAKQLGATEAMVRGMLRQLGMDADIPTERLPHALTAIATQYLAMLQELGRQKTDEGELGELRRQAIKALNDGAFEQAISLLNNIRIKERAASEQRRRNAEKARTEWLAGLQAEANICALLARAALSHGDVRGAVAQFHEGLEVLAVLEAAPRGAYALEAALALYDFGNIAGRNDALVAAINLYRRTLGDTPRERVPLDWANIQNNLGNALQALGQREPGIQRLEEAVATYRAALLERTRERVPLQWAATQNNLGNALQALGQRELGTQHLKEAVAAYRAALEEWSRERVPRLSAATQNNLGNALQALGQRESGTQRFEEAIAAYRAALEEWSRERAPLLWATAQNNLANALSTLGQREPGTQRLEEAVVSFRAALLERTRERVPLDWATTQNNLGGVLSIVGECESGTAYLEEAVAAFRAALLERTRERVPRLWAATQNNLGNALSTLGQREPTTQRLEEAVVAFRAALEEWSREGISLQWAMTESNLGDALLILGQCEPGAQRLEEAVVAFRAALKIFTAAGVAHYIEACEADKARAEELLKKRKRDNTNGTDYHSGN